ncbi:phage antirepressor [Vagococcus salmoninarum]|uniref:phage antirepressor n=1 Tax=Vagococcus salmoninarum TaxID=2739 RepID=UPI001881B13C|nr:phage antirepressor KilAC domain-containing protein [Vagococcus salmoninarum]MBE9387875.1 phage antirepressor KilAC domain-containing protein [Vagococcus salmoninarum]
MNLQVFNFESNQIRTMLHNGTPHFIGIDATKILGYKNSSKAIKDHCKNVKNGWANDSLGRQQEYKIIPESDIYRLIIKSKMPNAEKFEAWVMEDVLPSIRKHGMYAKDELLDNPELLLDVVTKYSEERTLRLVAEQRVNELQPKADYYDNILNNQGLVTISKISKNYGMSAVKFNQLLHDLGVQFNQSGTWLLYSKHQAKGYTHIEPFDYTDSNGNLQVKTRMKWTQKGHIFIYELLKKNGILPAIETLLKEA